MRFKVRYFNDRGKWVDYSTFGTLMGAIACVARLHNAGYRAQAYEV